MKMCLSNQGFLAALKLKLPLIKCQNKHVAYCMLSEREFPNSYFCSNVVLAYATKRNEN